MTSLQAAIARVFANYGTPLTLTTGGTGRTVQGLCVPMDNTTANIYFDGNETVGLFRPAVALYVAGTEPSPPAIGDVFTDADFPGPSRPVITVQKLQVFRVSGVVLAYLALCD